MGPHGPEVFLLRCLFTVPIPNGCILYDEVAPGPEAIRELATTIHALLRL